MNCELLSVRIAQPTHNSEIRNHKSLPFILPLLRRSDKENRYRDISERVILSLADKLHFQFVYIDSFAGGNKEAVILHFAIHVFISSSSVKFSFVRGKVVRRFLHVGVSVYFIKYKYHRFATAANLCQCLVHHLNLFLKSGWEISTTCTSKSASRTSSG